MRYDFSQPGGSKTGGTAVIVASLCLALWVSAPVASGAGGDGLADARASAAKDAGQAH